MESKFDLHDYSDIIDLPHHISSNRQHMSNVERGAQFSPFAALTGYGAAVAEAGRLTDQKKELSEDVKGYLDAKLQILSERIDECPEVTVTYFAPDQRKAGGAYLSHTGTLREIDPITRKVVMTDRTVIAIEQIRNLQGAIFGSTDWEL